MQVEYEIRASPVGGRGVFVKEDVKKGQLVWKYSPEVVREHPDDASVRRRLEGAKEEDVQDFLSHAYCWEGKVVEILDDGKYFNHSRTPNTGLLPEDPDSSFALRDISRGEELFDDYSAHDTLPWYETICAEYGTESVTKFGESHA